MASTAAPRQTNRLAYASLGLLVAGSTAVGLTSAPSPAHSDGETSDRPVSGKPIQLSADVHAATEQALRNVRQAAKPTATVRPVGDDVPAAARMYRVRPGDTLSAIAAASLGDPGRWPEIFDLNKGVPQADGQSLTDPNLIEVGWVLQVTAPIHLRSAVPDTGTPDQVLPSEVVTAAVDRPAVLTSPTVQARLATARPAVAARQAAQHRPTSVALRAPAQGSPRQIAQAMVPASQFHCFDEIITHESGWDVHATNPSSGAYGLPQSLPGHKMASAGADWRNDAATQIRWALKYMDGRYGSPCDAWSFWQGHSWY